MKIQISGLSGFIGSNLSQYLKNHSVDVHSIDLRKKVAVLNDTYAVIHLAGKAHDLKNVAKESDYYNINTYLTIELYKKFLASNVPLFIFVSSIKAVTDKADKPVNEDWTPNPKTIYGKSKLAAENYLISNLPSNKKLVILRPCMVHGPGNKGNLNLLFNLIDKRIPYPLGKYYNLRSMLGIANFCFIVHQILKNENFETGIYNLSDSPPISTKEVVKIIGNVRNIKVYILNLPKFFFSFIVKLCDIFGIQFFNSDKLEKLTQNYVVDNSKIISSIKSPLPYSSEESLIKTIASFK